ncbi:hypothetical protein [Sphingomonas montana]|uniref:hypothetical protein n=1 Tax=Sphingomonas montana TaxID=1843236 RepID=UPI00101AE9DC|nr:hypothetical protein [Sphingomonas montana]
MAGAIAGFATAGAGGESGKVAVPEVNGAASAAGFAKMAGTGLVRFACGLTGLAIIAPETLLQCTNSLGF